MITFSTDTEMGNFQYFKKRTSRKTLVISLHIRILDAY